jgi:large subunit ribosomal protein L18
MSVHQINRKAITRKRHYRLRRRLSGTADSPRLAVHRSSKHMYAQLINDLTGTTITSASTVEKDLKSSLSTGATVEAAILVGKTIATRALALGVETVVFDRGGYLYHGRVKSLADAAREQGLQF